MKEPQLPLITAKLLIDNGAASYKFLTFTEIAGPLLDVGYGFVEVQEAVRIYFVKVPQPNDHASYYRMAPQYDPRTIMCPRCKHDIPMYLFAGPAPKMECWGCNSRYTLNLMLPLIILEHGRDLYFSYNPDLAEGML